MTELSKCQEIEGCRNYESVPGTQVGLSFPITVLCALSEFFQGKGIPYKPTSDFRICPAVQLIVSSRLGAGRQGYQLRERKRGKKNETNLHEESTSLGPTRLVKAISHTYKKGKERNEITSSLRRQGRQLYKEMEEKERDEPKRSPPVEAPSAKITNQ